MAKIAIIGSSFSRCLYYVKDAPDMTDWTTEEREKWASDEWPLSFILQDYENHWVNLLAKKYPQHEFHVFAEGGAGWEFSAIILHKVAELNFDRVIVELQEPRLMIYNKTNSNDEYPVKEFILNENYLKNNKFRKPGMAAFYSWGKDEQSIFTDEGITSVCFYSKCLTSDDVKSQIQQTMEWQAERAEHFNNVGVDVNSPWVHTRSDTLRYIANYITGPIYSIRYRQYLLSLKNIWPKVFDEVGIWAYLSPNLPWSKLDLHAEIFGNELKIFEDVAIEEWIRKDSINNSFETWQNVYCGNDRQHANEEGMKLIVDFLLKQRSIQKVLRDDKHSNSWFTF